MGRDNRHMSLMRPRHCPSPRASAGRGFTLIELMVTVVVVGILATLAYPTFVDAVRKSRRSEAFAALITLQQAQERWRAGNATYSVDVLPLVPSATTANGHYALSVLSATTSGYVLVARARGGQAQDKACATMALSAVGGTIGYGSACSACTLSQPLSDPARCWSRQ
jgi:type IV pilus assembly protein PilE